MYHSLLNIKPASYNSCKGQKKINYFTKIQNSFRKYNNIQLINGKYLYGIIYYFYKIDLKIDSDNISKPVWDSLKNLIYNDDSQIKFRVACSLNLKENNISEFDITKLPNNIINDLLNFLDDDQTNHFIYLECGEFSSNLVKFSIEV